MITLKEDFMVKALFSSKEIILKQFISDVLSIPMEEIRSVRIANPYLKKKYYRHKQGILDILLFLNEDKKVNIELQVKTQKEWKKRNLFYLAEMYTEDLQMEEDYGRLRKCICISILDFNLTNSPTCHTSYRLRDTEGNEFSDQWELHTIELCKSLEKGSTVCEWVSLFNAKTEGEMDMILSKTKNEGIMEAVREMKILNLRKRIRYEYKLWLKARRDRWAEDDFIRDEAILKEKGIIIKNMLAQNMPMTQICQIVECDEDFVEKIREGIQS